MFEYLLESLAVFVALLDPATTGGQRCLSVPFKSKS